MMATASQSEATYLTTTKKHQTKNSEASALAVLNFARAAACDSPYFR
uniref:Uncharacterized protein n=1 Tax=Arundo donax TaxID=35708 RepID=A0A0A9ELW9_ARUDO